MPSLEDGALVAIDGKIGNVIASFEDQYVSTGRSQAGGDGRAADA
jgi:hypothetical protein